MNETKRKRKRKRERENYNKLKCDKRGSGRGYYKLNKCKRNVPNQHQ
jgi:hypothetical protein